MGKCCCWTEQKTQRGSKVLPELADGNKTHGGPSVWKFLVKLHEAILGDSQLSWDLVNVTMGVFGTRGAAFLNWGTDVGTG